MGGGGDSSGDVVIDVVVEVDSGHWTVDRGLLLWSD